MQEGQSWQQVCPGNSCSDSTSFQAQSLEPSKQPLHNEHRIPHLPYGPTREKCRVQSDGRQGVRCHPPTQGPVPWVPWPHPRRHPQIWCSVPALTRALQRAGQERRQAWQASPSPFFLKMRQLRSEPEQMGGCGSHQHGLQALISSSVTRHYRFWGRQEPGALIL